VSSGIGVGIGALAVVGIGYLYFKSRGAKFIEKLSSSNAPIEEKRKKLRLYIEKGLQPNFSKIGRRICPVCRKTYDAIERTHVGWGENDKLKFSDKGCPVCGTKVVFGKNDGRYHLVRESVRSKKYNYLYNELCRLVEEIRPRSSTDLRGLLDSINDHSEE
jgi:hypothetical protein